MAELNGIVAGGESIHKAPRFDLGEIGHSGLISHAGHIDEEIERRLKSTKQFKAYREMQDNSAIVGALLFAIKQLARGASWSVVPFSDDMADQERAEFVDQVLFQDMSQSWSATLSEILSFLTFGFSYHEIVWKVRGGDVRDSQRKSKFNDGKVGVRKLACRAQESLDRWILADEDSSVQAFVQLPQHDFQTRVIPIEKALLFRTESTKGNPQGRSILRNAYTSYYRQNHIMNIEGIGIERDLAGLPVMYLPPNLFNASAGSAESTAYQNYQDLVMNVRRDEMEGLLLPAVFDERGNRLYEFVLANSGGRRQFDTDKIITRYDQRIAMTTLAEFILIGQGGSGSRALHVDKSEIFTMALAAYLDEVQDTINMHLIPRLFRVNGMPTDRLPEIEHSKIQKVDLAEFGQFIGQLAGAGVPLFPNPELEQFLAELGGYPPPAMNIDESA